MNTAKKLDSVKKKLPESLRAIDYEKLDKLKEAGLELNRVYCYQASDIEYYYFIPLKLELEPGYRNLYPREDSIWTFNSKVTNGVVSRWNYSSLYLPYFIKSHVDRTFVVQSNNIIKLKLRGIIPSDLTVY